MSDIVTHTAVTWLTEDDLNLLVALADNRQHFPPTDPDARIVVELAAFLPPVSREGSYGRSKQASPNPCNLGYTTIWSQLCRT